MLPIDQIWKTTSPELKAVILVIGATWAVTTIIRTRAQYELAKKQTELIDLQLAQRQI